MRKPKKELLLSRIEQKLTNEGALIVSEQSHRSQALNRKYAWEKLVQILQKGLRPPEPRRKTRKKRPKSLAARKAQTRHSEKKQMRRKIRPHQI